MVPPRIDLTLPLFFQMYFLDADNESDDDMNMENVDENVNVAPKERSASLL